MDSLIHRPPNILDPLNWPAVFGNDQPVEVDVGCGKGGFLLWAAQTRPTHNFLGIERLLVRLRKVDRKAGKRGLTNVRLIRLEASYLIGKLVPAGSVAAYHVYFPDPWPKRRHERHRLFSTGFVSDLHRTLRPAGTVSAATDHEPYFRQIEAVMAGNRGFTPLPVEDLPAEAQTEFEKEFVAAGKPIWRARWGKTN
jgi:tRNA (guanine-N7-)-methyltransferase